MNEIVLECINQLKLNGVFEFDELLKTLNSQTSEKTKAFRKRWKSSFFLTYRPLQIEIIIKSFVIPKLYELLRKRFSQDDLKYFKDLKNELYKVSKRANRTYYLARDYLYKQKRKTQRIGNL